MNNLIINPTQLTPKVIFDIPNYKFEISGESTPENAAEFYMPIIEWLKEYESILYFGKGKFGKTKKVTLEMKFDYFNSTSAKFILDIFFAIQKYIKEGFDAEINWHYDNGDIDMQESGEEFASLCADLPINYICNN